MSVSSGTTVTNVVAISGAVLEITAAPNTYIRGTSNGSAFEMKDAAISGYVIDCDGKLTIITAAAISTVVNDGGMKVASGGLATSTIVNSCGAMFVSSSGAATSTIVNSAGSIQVEEGGAATSTIVNSCGEMYVEGGTADNVDVQSGGYLEVCFRGVVNAVCVEFGGTMYVGKSSTATEISENGGYVNVADGARAIFVSNCLTGLVLSDGRSASLHSGTTANSTILGWESVLDVAGGVANSTAVDRYSHLYVSGGGVANSTTVNSGSWMIVSSGGTANATVVTGSFTGIEVDSGGTANSTTLNNCGEMYVSSGGKITGILNLSSGAIVHAYAGSVIDFDLSAAAPGDPAQINDLSLIQGSPDYTITVSVTQAEGTYELAGGVSEFDRTVTVVTDAGKMLGQVIVGETLGAGGHTYSLELDSGTLSLTVDGGTPPTVKVTPGDLNGDGRADIVMTIAQEGHAADGSTGAWLIQADQTAEWGDLSQRNPGWEIFGMGYSTSGKSTNDVYVKSADNVVGAWVTDAAGAVTGWETVGQFDANTQVLGLGDFNGDGQSDLLLRNDNGAVGCYFTDGTGWNYFQSLGDEWTVAAVGDLNGDGRDDVVLKHDAGFAGSWLTQSDYTMAWANLDTLAEGFSIVGTGDFDGDGTDDMLLKNWNYYGAWLVQDGSVKSWMGLGYLGDVTVEEIADFDGDGTDDLRVRTTAGDLGAQLVKGADTLDWKYYGSVGAEWSTALTAI